VNLTATCRHSPMTLPLGGHSLMTLSLGELARPSKPRTACNGPWRSEGSARLQQSETKAALRIGTPGLKVTRPEQVMMWLQRRRAKRLLGRFRWTRQTVRLHPLSDIFPRNSQGQAGGCKGRGGLRMHSGASMRRGKRLDQNTQNR